MRVIEISRDLLKTLECHCLWFEQKGRVVKTNQRRYPLKSLINNRMGTERINRGPIEVRSKRWG